MRTEPCERCTDPVPLPLLRDIELRVDGAGVDAQALCPDCFADWITRYQEEMAVEMAGSGEPETTGDDIRIAEEDESVRSHDFSDDPLGDAVSDSGDDIRDLGMGPNRRRDDDVDGDLDGEAAVGDDEERDDGSVFD